MKRGRNVGSIGNRFICHYHSRTYNLVQGEKGNRPIKGGGFGIILPLLIIAVIFTFSISQLMNIPGKPFHFPALWELAIAGLLGAVFGVIMLSQTAYEIREDGFVYSSGIKL